MDDSNNKKMLKTDQTKICNLPDAVLHHILSFLDMKEVVATSLLATRWRYLWVSVPVLNFRDSLWKMKWKDDILRPKGFMNFVDRVLLLRDCSGVRKFQITCSSYCDPDRIDAWLTVATRRQISELHILLLVKEPMEELPHLLFSSSITVLKLDVDTCLGLHRTIHIPSSVCSSPLLKTLVLLNIALPKGNSDGELVFSNPVLENLTLIECEQAHLNVLNISTYRLKNLVFLNSIYDSIETCLIKICTPNLESIDIGGFWYENCCLGNLSSLVSAKFDFRFARAQYLDKILECVSCPTTIGVSACLEHHEKVPDMLTRPYTNIKCLKFYKCSLRRCDCRKPGCTWGYECYLRHLKHNCYLLNVLSMCPCLETLYLDVYAIENLQVEYMFPITFYHLKHVEIGKLAAARNELKFLKFLKFLLKNAIILEKLVIVTDSSSSDLKTKRDFGDKIHSLTKPLARLTVLLL